MIIQIRRPQHLSKGIKFFSVYAPSTILNEDYMSKTIARLKTARSAMSVKQEPKRKAAVLIPLCIVDGQVSLLYTLRTSHLRSHKGQVSFPGGMEDSQDLNLEQTALRETEEELGVPPSQVVLWGTGNFIAARGNCILPVVGQIKGEFRLDQLKINPHEVKEAFTVSLADLCDPSKNAYTQFKTGYSLPVFTGGPRRIWGVTAAITNSFLKALLPNEGYHHRIKYSQSFCSTNLD